MGKFIFTIQGEGRGHLTQAISLTQIAREAGHEVVGYAIGAVEGRKIPDFFIQFIGDTPLIQYESPTINYGKGSSVHVGKTALQGFTKLASYCKSAKKLECFISDLKPDGLINFYEAITGLYYLKTRSKIPCMSLGHQYLLLNKYFKSIKEKPLDQFLLNLNTKITGIGSRKFLGLSFMAMPNDLQKNIIVVPPLLRQEVKFAQKKNGENWLVYLTHFKLAEGIIKWSNENPTILIDCFWDNPTKPEVLKYSDNLTFHPIDANKYLLKMTECAGLISTAGFESVAEAMYLNKPVMMVPVPNHIEQMINAHDGQRAGAGIAASKFNLDLFKNYLPHHPENNEVYVEWCQSSKQIMAKELQSLIQNATPKSKTSFYQKLNSYRFNLTNRLHWRGV